jgi:hypothetical protein
MIVSLVAASCAATAHASPAACGKVLPPAQGIYFGVMPGWQFSMPTYDDAVGPTDVPNFESVTGRHVVIAHWRMSWHDALRFPTKDVEVVWREGFVPQIGLVSLPTQDYGAPQVPPPGPYPNSAIAAGVQDDSLRRFADAARATDIPIELDYDSEMQAAHPWGGRFDGGGATAFGDPSWPDGPEHYRDAFRHIVDIFRQEGATNVTFVFHANTLSGYRAGDYWDLWEQLKYYYPGDDYVDWIGLSVYPDGRFGTDQPPTFEQKLSSGIDGFGGSYAEITSLTNKPLQLTETGLYLMPSEAAKAQWVEDASRVIQSGEFPRIDALNWWAQNKGGDYDAYPTSSDTFLNGFRRAFDQPYFDAPVQFSGDCSPLAPARVKLNKHVLTWAIVPNAARYEVWRGTKQIAVTTSTSLRMAKPGAYRVRGINLVGPGPFAVSH